MSGKFGANSDACAPGPRLGLLWSSGVILSQIWDSVWFWRRAAAVLATTGCALLVAALVAREPPNFAERPVIAVLRDAWQHPGWSVRLARLADQIAVDSEGPPPPPSGKNYQLWIAPHEMAPPQPLGLLPLTGRKIFAVAPSNIRLLTGNGELWVTLEAATGTLAEAPGGAPVFHAALGKGS